MVQPTWAARPPAMQLGELAWRPVRKAAGRKTKPAIRQIERGDRRESDPWFDPRSRECLKRLRAGNQLSTLPMRLTCAFARGMPSDSISCPFHAAERSGVG